MPSCALKEAKLAAWEIVFWFNRFASVKQHLDGQKYEPHHGEEPGMLAGAANRRDGTVSSYSVTGVPVKSHWWPSCNSLLMQDGSPYPAHHPVTDCHT
jgi:hypothetical protein